MTIIPESITSKHYFHIFNDLEDNCVRCQSLSIQQLLLLLSRWCAVDHTNASSVWFAEVRISEDEKKEEERNYASNIWNTNISHLVNFIKLFHIVITLPNAWLTKLCVRTSIFYYKASALHCEHACKTWFKWILM